MWLKLDMRQKRNLYLSCACSRRMDDYVFVILHPSKRMFCASLENFFTSYILRCWLEGRCFGIWHYSPFWWKVHLCSPKGKCFMSNYYAEGLNLRSKLGSFSISIKRDIWLPTKPRIRLDFAFMNMDLFWAEILYDDLLDVQFLARAQVQSLPINQQQLARFNAFDSPLHVVGD